MPLCASVSPADMGWGIRESVRAAGVSKSQLGLHSLDVASPRWKHLGEQCLFH